MIVPHIYHILPRDHRNLGLVGTTDGVPLFDNMRRGLWPFFIRVANLPDALSTHMANVHMTLVGANEYHELNPATNTLWRKVHAPKSLTPHLTIIVDDLYHAYRHGIPCEDSTMASNDPNRLFRCRVVLLAWLGDYPAQAASAGMHSKCCHWCEFKGKRSDEINRTLWCDHRRFLGDQHPWRRDGRFGGLMTDPPPLYRTGEATAAAGRRNEQWTRAKNAAPWKTTGVKTQSPLSFLPLFDLVWDMGPDMMHLVLNFFDGHVLPLYTGKRYPAKPKARKNWTPSQNAQLMKDHRDQMDLHESWQLPDVVCKVFMFLYLTCLCAHV